MKNYPWLNIKNTMEEYVDPEYYNRLLRDYIFRGKTDLEIFASNIYKGKMKKALEIGCGNGRATKIFLDRADFSELCLVDLSRRMIKNAKENFPNRRDLKFECCDGLEYLEQAEEKYDFIFSLWSFSHAVHQMISRLGLAAGKERIGNLMEKMVLCNMEKRSKFFLIHFDSLSDEQKILIRQWKKNLPIFSQNKIQSPSKRFINYSLRKLQKRGIIKLDIRHLKGEPIIYKSQDEALEIFMNFHMETFFNRSLREKEVLSELKKYFLKFKRKDGLIAIRPGCFVYSFEKITN